MNYKLYSFVKLFLLVASLMLAGFLAFVVKDNPMSVDHSLVFVVDVNKTMNTQDVFSGTTKMSRLDATKYLIKDIVLAHSGYAYGLIIFNASIDYIVPPTFDTGTFFLYMIGMTTNLLPDGIKDFAVLSNVMKQRDDVSYILLSDFDTSLSQDIVLPSSTRLIGLGSIEGDSVRTANGIRYYDNGASVSSVRNDVVARSLGVSYVTVATLDAFSPEKVVFGGFHLPFSQRMLLYAVLGVLVILVVMF